MRTHKTDEHIAHYKLYDNNQMFVQIFVSVLHLDKVCTLLLCSLQVPPFYRWCTRVLIFAICCILAYLVLRLVIKYYTLR